MFIYNSKAVKRDGFSYFESLKFVRCSKAVSSVHHNVTKIVILALEFSRRVSCCNQSPSVVVTKRSDLAGYEFLRGAKISRANLNPQERLSTSILFCDKIVRKIIVERFLDKRVP